MKKAVFVTGAAAGTGIAIAEKFAADGYAVFLTSRERERAQTAARGIAERFGVFAKGYALGIRDEEAVKAVFRGIDALGCVVKAVVLNAANMGFGTDPAAGMDPLTVDIADFQEVFETNLVWNFMIVRQAALRMKDHDGGAVVFLSSNTAYRAIPNRTAYCASKGGINAMVRALAVDFGKYGIRVNAVLPGTIKTERWVQMGSRQIVNGELTPIGDISDFEDIANAAWFLGTDLSKNITGTELTVDGGMSCQLYPQVLNTLKRRYQNEKEND